MRNSRSPVEALFITHTDGMRKLFLTMTLSVACTMAGVDDFPESGISFTPTGVVDHRSGFEWLDAGLTEGNIYDLEFGSSTAGVWPVLAEAV